MKVFQINTVYNSGSTGRIVADLKHLLEKNGNECFAAYGRGCSKEENTYCVSNKVDLYVHAMLTRLTDKTGFYSINSTKRLIKQIKRENPDIIHLHNIHGYYLNVEILFRFLKEYDRPVVWTFHDCWPYTGHCVHYGKYARYELCDKWKTQCEGCKRSVEYPSSWRDCSKWNYLHKKHAFTSLDKLHIVTVSGWLKNQVSQSFLKNYPIHTIYNGIDLQKIGPVEDTDLRGKYELGEKKVVLGVANIWSPLKGVEDFVRLADLLDGKNYQIVILGIDEKQKSILPPQILALPRTESIGELAAWYSTAEVHYNASRAETFGMTVIEALACGTPVVTYNICAMSEILNEQCGFLVDRIGDVESAAERIILCSKEEMKTACIERSRAFEKEAQYMKYMELYNKISNKTEKL